jgi:hypothetical protein
VVAGAGDDDATYRHRAWGAYEAAALAIDFLKDIVGEVVRTSSEPYQTVISEIVHTLKVDRRNKLGIVELGRDATALQGPSHTPACRRLRSDGVLGSLGAHLANHGVH